MSDEGSGPEGGSGESKEEWKLRMATLSGMNAPMPDTIAKLKFLEVVKPGWRSQAVR
jgi:hypothetical protein